MTIFQKMLVLPLLSLVLYSGFIVYSYRESDRINHSIVVLRDDYLPLQELLNDNVRLFDQITGGFKDAVVSGDIDWLDQNRQLELQLEKNLERIAAFDGIVERSTLTLLRESFARYCEYATQLSLFLLDNPEALAPDDDLLNKVNFFHNRSKQLIDSMKAETSSSFKGRVNATHSDQKRLVFISSNMAAFLLVSLAAIGLSTSLSVRRKLAAINRRMRDLANGSTDFSRRLKTSDSDELATLTYWFNQLSDKLERDYKQVEQISITDKLTGLNNRFRTDAFLADKLAEVGKEPGPLCVALLDIDHFKSINDTYGHLTGDQVLIAVADILKISADPGDFIGRWGGEEFILVLPGKPLPEARRQAERVREKIAGNHMPEVGTITASFGVCELQPGDSVDHLLKCADDRLYRAKHTGRNRVVASEGE